MKDVEEEVEKMIIRTVSETGEISMRSIFEQLQRKGYPKCEIEQGLRTFQKNHMKVTNEYDTR